MDAASERQLEVPGAGTAPAAEKSSGLRSAYATFMLALVMMLTVADRNLVAVLLVPIQKDLKVSDAAMGVLTGISFTLVYAATALPMARLADKGKRRDIIAAAVAFWSAMTAVCGLAGNYLTLLLARMGVAAGLAAAYPAKMSMIGDLFSFKQRGTALAFIMIGAAVGTALGAYVAGALSDRYSWQVAFFALGLPGLLFAAVFLLTVREPKRGAQDGGDHADAAAERWTSCLRHLLRTPSVPPLLVSVVFINLAFAIYIGWIPAYLMRVHAMTATQASAWFGFTSATAMLGILTGGYLSDRLAAHGPRWRLLLMAGIMAAQAPLFSLMMVSPSLQLVLPTMCVYAFLGGPVSSIYPAAALDVARPRMRGTLLAVVAFCAQVVGQGLGPILLGALNDGLKQTYGAQSLRYALMALPVCLVLGALSLLWTSRFTNGDAAAARRTPKDEPQRS